jgi:hypothetical protein
LPKTQPQNGQTKTFLQFSHWSVVISQWLREFLPQLYFLRLCPFASLRETKNANDN